MSKHDLNSLLGSRICHDLISPLGAIGNGVELLTMSGSGAAPEIALIAESVENANARIRFFRVAFGMASAGQRLGSSEVGLILKDVYKSSRLKVDWQVERDCLRHDAKLAFLLLLCMETAMPWGGRVTVRHEDERWEISGAAERLSVNADMWALLENRESRAELTSANVHFALAPEMARTVGRTIEARLDPALIHLTF